MSTPKIGVTGSAGFVGGHLVNYLRHVRQVEVATYDVPDFADEAALVAFANEVDVVVHLAAVNRDEDERRLHDTNVRLVERLVAGCAQAVAPPAIVFSSSTHIDRDTLYARSKRRGMELLEAYAKTSGTRAVNLVIPNVFGPFAQPKYNSVVATFCHRIARGEAVEIHQDAQLDLIYVNELVGDITGAALGEVSGRVDVAPRHRLGVAALARRLSDMHAGFSESGTVPDLYEATTRALFNTYYCYWYAAHGQRAFVKHTDPRGSFIEVARTLGRGQFSYSTTVPGVTRGNHFHTRKAERFAVIAGRARISVRRVGQEEARHFDLDGEQPGYVDMPVWHTHNITNTGEDTLVCLFWISEPYDPTDADTFFVPV